MQGLFLIVHGCVRKSSIVGDNSPVAVATASLGVGTNRGNWGGSTRGLERHRLSGPVGTTRTRSGLVGTVPSAAGARGM
jgi:hypothetical protein